MSSGLLSVFGSKMAIQAFRDSAAPGADGEAAYGVLSINKELSGGSTIAGLVRKPMASHKISHDKPHPIHLAHRRSLRAYLHETTAGHHLARRKLAAIEESKQLPDHQRRRLGYGDTDFFYQKADLPSRTVNVDCYDDKNGGAYAGSPANPGTGEGANFVPCATWASAAAAFGVGLDAAGVCSVFGATPNPDFTATLDGNNPRVPCVGFLGDAPWCYLDRGGGSWGATTMPSLLKSCTSMYVEELHRVYTPGHAGTDTTKTPIKPDWYWGVDRIKLEDAVYDSDPNALLYDGTGVHVFVIDTGVNLNHAEFAGRVGTSFRAYSVGDEGPVECDPSDVSKCIDVDGHGTHCASTILGAQAGVAPGAILHAVGVFDPTLGGKASGRDSATGLQWIVDYYERELKPNGIPAIVSASMGCAGSRSSDMKWSLPANAGMLTLVAAGNDDHDACLGSPARMGGAENKDFPLLTIGASNVDDSKALFSNWGSCVSLWAPGTGILAARHDSDTLMTVMSGTSMATPIAAGVATLAMEVAGVASLEPFSHMSAQTAMDVKNWILHSALHNKITALAPASIVPVSFVSTIQENRPTSYAVARMIAGATVQCGTLDTECQAANQVGDEVVNVASSPNLLVHVPAYLQAGAPAVEPLDCALYDEPTYEEECPPPGIELCGGPMGISPIDGASIRRPYRKMRKTCTFGCQCADGEEVETYESCAVADSDYRYTNRPCAPVYKIDSEMATRTLQGTSITWAPLAGGESYSVVDVQPETPLDDKCMGLKENLFEVRGTDYIYTFSTNKYDLPDDGARYFGTTFSAPFKYYNTTYDAITLYNDGYMCFGKNFKPQTGSFGSWQDHFSHKGGTHGACFSFLLTDMESSTVERCSRLKNVGPNGWEADSMTFTFNRVGLFGGDFTGEEIKPTATVQVKLEFGSNKITARYGELHDSLSAIIGPSKGEGVPPGFAADLPSIPV